MRLNLCALITLLVLSFSVSAQDAAVDFATQSVRIAVPSEPRNLNSIRATDQVSIFYLEHVLEGLLRVDERNQLAPGVAERWEMTDTSARFWLRRNAVWSDGKPVTAHDFVFAWRQVVNPEVAAEYASIMFPVKNAEKITTGELPVEALGVQALDDYTLEVQLESPTGYFLALTSFMVYYPAREDFYRAQNNRYFADVENMIFNGPFKITSWIHGASLRMEKNERYWNADSVTLNVVDTAYITPDGTARFNLFKDGKVAVENGIVGLSAAQMNDALANRMRLHSHSDGSVFYLEFNQREDRLTRNLNLRRAVQSIFDSQEAVYKALGIAGYIPGRALVPTYMNGVERKFREEYPERVPPLDVEAARHYLELAKQELGLEQIPPLAILVDDGNTGPLLAQYLQALFKRKLGLDIRIDIQNFKQRLDKMQAGNFDLVVAGWGPDYEDPFTFIELFASWNVNNKGRYNSPVYDALVRRVQGSSDQQIRMDAMGQAQQLLIDDAVILPAYERVSTVVQHPKLQGMQYKQVGASMVFTHARVVE